MEVAGTAKEKVQKEGPQKMRRKRSTLSCTSSQRSWFNKPFPTSHRRMPRLGRKRNPRLVS